MKNNGDVIVVGADAGDGCAHSEPAISGLRSSHRSRRAARLTLASSVTRLAISEQERLWPSSITVCGANVGRASTDSTHDTEFTKRHAPFEAALSQVHDPSAVS